MSATRRDLLFFRAAPARRVAVLDTTACLAWNRSFCTVCVERCPRPGAVHLVGQLPRIDSARCDGCGDCVEVCPSPIPALRVA